MAAQGVHADLRRAGQVLEVADKIRADEAGQIADRIDQRNARRSAGSGQKSCRQGPEERRAGDRASRRQRQEGDGDRRIGGRRGDEKPTAPSSAGTTRCQRRSRCLSALRPNRFMATTAQMKGMALISPILRLPVTPVALTSVGIQKVSPYWPITKQK